VNGDGYADLAVGALFFADNDVGKAYVYHGSANGLNLSANWSAVGEAISNYFGDPVAPAGDVNGDSYADLAVSANGYNNGTGKAYVYYGSAGGLNASAGWSAVGEAESNYLGSVGSAGDVNGDGYTDLAVGAAGFNANTGKVYAYQGSSDGLSETANWTAVGESADDFFGSSVASAGDVNGDGYADLVVGAWGFNNNTGKAYVYHGSAIPAGCVSNCLQVAAIRMWADASFIYASVKIKDEKDKTVPRATVSAHWDLPGGGVLDQKKSTSASGLVTFKVAGGAGPYTITVTNIIKAGYTFDPENSAILSKSIMK
jgi:hypothetical protein